MILSTQTWEISERIGDKEAIRIIAQAGFDAYDCSLFPPHHSERLDTDNYADYYRELRAFADNLGIPCNQAHAPTPSSNGKPEMDERLYTRVIRGIECAAILGAKIIIVHPIQHLVYGDHAPELFERNISFYRSLIPYCEQYGIKVAVENMWQRNPASKAIVDSTCSRGWEFCQYLDAIDSGWIVGCLDIGHASLMGTDIPTFIRTLGNRRLQALHVHDNDGKEDLHTLPFTQRINYPAVVAALKEIKYQGDFTFEADGFLRPLPTELLPDASAMMCKVGRYLTGD